MTAMRKLAASLVLGLVMCLALFTTGAFAHTAHRSWNWHHHFLGVQVSSVAVADPGFFGFGCFPFFDGAFAHANVHIFGDNFWGW